MKPRSRFRGLTLFVTVGSTKFDELIQRVLSDDMVDQLTRLGFAKMVVQAGASDYDRDAVQGLSNTSDMDIEIYDYKTSIKEDIEAADLVVGHAGAGTCLEVLRMNRRLLLVVNENLMDNHQSELADELVKENLVHKTNVDRLTYGLEIICDSGTKIDKFSEKDQSKFNETLNEALLAVYPHNRSS